MSDSGGSLGGEWLWVDEAYGRQLKCIRDAVGRLYAQDEREYPGLPYYTPHDVGHCDRVERRIHDLIPDEHASKLSPKERFYLLAAAWLHDVGMLKTVVKSIKNESISDDEIRRQHHIISEEYISKHWTDVGIDDTTDAGTLAKICRYHRRSESIMDCEPTSGEGKEEVKVRLLASYLRIADSLDIGPERTPPEAYMLCLAYDIPEDPRLHWIKSRLVRQVSPNSHNHTITVEFMYPYPQQVEEQIGVAGHKKTDDLIKLIVDDLQDELTSVMNVITRSGPVYYLDVVPKTFKQVLVDTLANDLREILINFDVATAPSASKLLEIILVSAANIMGYSLIKGKNPHKLAASTGVDYTEVRKRLNQFLEALGDKVASTRPCHLGLKTLIEECKGYCSRVTNTRSLSSVVEEINKRYQAHHGTRHAIRDKSRKFFHEVRLVHSIDNQINVLLYGYSELVTKAVCGLRDYLMDLMYPGINPKHVYDKEEEKIVSERICIFVCEGQPKTQVGYNDRLVYHDGSQYALHLAERKFSNINIIPDIIARTVMTEVPIDYVLIGANGVTSEHFTHSAGHRAIVDLARAQRRDSINGSPVTILVTSREKVTLVNQEQADAVGPVVDATYIVEECCFRNLSKCNPTRKHIWISRDKQLLGDLTKEGVCFANPREDKIPIHEIDYIISDVGWSEVTPDTSCSVVSNLFG